MQTKAEEKRKGYTCVVWASCVVTRSMLDELETLSRSGAHLDEMGEPCIEVGTVFCSAELTDRVLLIISSCALYLTHRLFHLCIVFVCMQLNQKTPLRVLHRRSLLDRKRHVYQIETVLLNDHFFLMNLVTSAGK